MSGEASKAGEVVLDVEAYKNPVDAFNTVGAVVLEEAQARGIITFEEDESRDAIDTLNAVAEAVGDDEQDSLYDKLGFLVDMHNTDEFKLKFAFSIEAVRRDGKFRIWWAQ